ncbi:MAG: ATP-dependent DNA helicase RecG [Bacteroidetes bacterium]|nr:MAG: ATP-dependent DNA helicase RecG [Bacteroidota bacterium]
MENIFHTKIQYLKGIGDKRAELLREELRIFTYRDLLYHFPYRYEDRSTFFPIGDLNEDENHVQILGTIQQIKVLGEGHSKRVMAILEDQTGMVELVWFKGVTWVLGALQVGKKYAVYGKVSLFGSRINIAHPDFELYDPNKTLPSTLLPVYSVTEKMKKFHFESKYLANAQKEIFRLVFDHLNEFLPEEILISQNLISRKKALLNIHFPKNTQILEQARKRMKFEELFAIQLKLVQNKQTRRDKSAGQIFKSTTLLTNFYKNHLPFDLTNAQKKVLREIHSDCNSGKQMNRLLQGDVGCGKTIVAFINMLMGIDNGVQTCLMAPTEILAQQHFASLKEFADLLDIKIALLTGSTKNSQRKIILENLKNGELNILVGTHALIEDDVIFKNLGLCVIDEQHRFGVAQRAKLWKKNVIEPHILVMTATPIPRTLAMTLYGDLDVSVIDELPKGRKPIKTIHKYDSARLTVFGLLKTQIDLGRQIYIVYPLIEESENFDYKNLMEGYEAISRAFPDIPLSILHGKMKSADKDFEMQRFVRGETKIMVATTVIEVGVNVPNATVMVIENAERFGLSQLHQLRGRVGRGADQSFCVLMTDVKLSRDSRNRMDTMVRTNNGFEIAEADLKLRGPGDLAGTQQSGIVDLQIADLAKDQQLLQNARQIAIEIIDSDPTLSNPKYNLLKEFLEGKNHRNKEWAKIS